jgi:hypothetical protein
MHSYQHSIRHVYGTTYSWWCDGKAALALFVSVNEGSIVVVVIVFTGGKNVVETVAYGVQRNELCFC